MLSFNYYMMFINLIIKNMLKCYIIVIFEFEVYLNKYYWL